MPSSTIGRTTTVSADHVVAHTLLNCYLREIAGREGQAEMIGDELHVRLTGLGVTLRIAVRRRALSGAHRFAGPVFGDDGELHWRAVAERLADELTLATGIVNDEFTDQVAASHAVTEESLRDSVFATDPYLASEQALALGHRFHPTPKARTGAGEWQRYAPERGSRISLRYLAARADVVREQTVAGDDLSILDELLPAPAGYRLLPVHPWQFELLRHNATLAAALRDGRLLDLGAGGPSCTPTSSVRTLHTGAGFLKFSLNVRITNCVRKNSAYELAAAVALTGLLDRELADTHVLREPGYRTVELADRELYEGFGVIVREGLARHLPPGGTPLVAAAVADEYPLSPAHVSHLVDPSDVVEWWRAYLRLLVPPVLTAFFAHGVVLEPHLQNVLVCVDPDGMPVRMLFRDMEGTKLLAEHHASFLATLPPEVAGPMTYTPAKGWQRVAYCLLVNHVAEVLAALADLRPDSEAELWALVRAELAAHPGAPPELRAVLAGVPVPAKANLLARWQRDSDRHADYVPLSLPIA
ncbi:MAG TPA: IucA/IucC family protein [Pseudonocardiaceae bacterium]|jgi:siderophore synthetase component|nr:IucA/IucC family protein [Pseudonocardiaceae bacterium]